MTISVDPVARLDDLDQVGWDTLTAHGDFYVSSTGLRIYEELYPREAGYLRAVEDGRMVAALAWYRLDADSRPSPFTRPDRLLARMVEASGNQAVEEDLYPLLPAMLCGGRAAGPSRLLRAPGPPGDQARWLAATIAAGSALAAERGAASLCMPYVDVADSELCAALRGDGWTQIATDSYYLLDVTWPDFDGYLAGLPAKRRTSVRRELTRLGEEGIGLGSERADGTLIGEMADLAVNLKRRHGSPRTAADIAESISAFVRQAGDSYLVTTARHEGRLVGYCFFLRWRDELYGRDAGFDYAVQEERNVSLYFPTVFYEAARISPELGVTTVHYGVGSDGAKLSRRSRGIAQAGFFKPLTDAASGVLSRYAPLCGAAC
ncbi:MAG TPA: GNAT family N-acetyltransferase [Streptosporangiaceae bacterium]